LIIVFSKISRVIYNCEGGDFPKKKHALVTCSKKTNAPKTVRFSFWKDEVITDESRGWSRFARAKRFALRKLDIEELDGKGRR